MGCSRENSSRAIGCWWWCVMACAWRRGQGHPQAPATRWPWSWTGSPAMPCADGSAAMGPRPPTLCQGRPPPDTDLPSRTFASRALRWASTSKRHAVCVERWCGKLLRGGVWSALRRPLPRRSRGQGRTRPAGVCQGHPTRDRVTHGRPSQGRVAPGRPPEK